MKAKTRKCMAVLGIIAVFCIYAAGIYRIEMARQAPRVAICTFGHCVPTDATFSVLR
ncbi:hypothetical protein [Pseudomonas sp. NPDC089734]|uniref:hypothetical protein n=1 Tax=Pseudomonas sp. NPDC089734 TaxID=3364469 RepID=UPI00381C41A9